MTPNSFYEANITLILILTLKYDESMLITNKYMQKKMIIYWTVDSLDN